MYYGFMFSLSLSANKRQQLHFTSSFTFCDKLPNQFYPVSRFLSDLVTYLGRFCELLHKQVEKILKPAIAKEETALWSHGQQQSRRFSIWRNSIRTQSNCEVRDGN